MMECIMSQARAWTHPPRTREEVVDLAPSISQLYREMQVAHGALARMAAILEQVAATMPADGD
jgi:hypothetical protein